MKLHSGDAFGIERFDFDVLSIFVGFQFLYFLISGEILTSFFGYISFLSLAVKISRGRPEKGCNTNYGFLITNIEKAAFLFSTLSARTC